MKKNRRSIRLQGYDYAQAGAYFVTICTQNHKCLFGNIMDGEMILNDVGRMVTEEWMKSVDIRNEIELDAFVVMPNHIHGIVWIRTGDHCMGDHCRGDRLVAPTVKRVRASGPKPKSIGSFVAGFKSAATTRINKFQNTRGAKLWQRNYYDRIVRNEKELNGMREYVVHNSLQWELDQENPNAGHL